MSRELRNTVYVIGAVLLLGAIVLAFLPVSVAGVVGSVDCGGPLSTSGLDSLYPECGPALQGRGMWATVVGLLGVGVLAFGGYMAYAAGSKTATA